MALFDLLPTAAYVLQNDRIVAFNAVAVELLGHTASEIRKARYWELCDRRAQAEVRDRGRAWLRGLPMEPHGVCPVVSAKGELHWIEAFRRRIDLGGAPAILVTAIDLTSRWTGSNAPMSLIGRIGGPMPADRAAVVPEVETKGLGAPGAIASSAMARQLPPRQAEVLELVSRGLSNKQIARLLGITEGTAKLHVFALMRTFQVANRTMLALIAHDAVAVDEP